ncbi:NAD(P)/FAD-dependent oxidoreductase [Asticcacaulis solisilvae]|uniref:NAD(P)/FAD-dependent oxidoreductase n=1 Tax=Asticcacaulis solisilvae TaxID=1217274 RepID=UPI003FD71E54
MNIFIIGGGIVGLNAALELQGRGHSVTVYERSEGGSVAASYGNAGHIATEQVEPLASQAMIRSAFSRLFINGGALSLPPAGIAKWLPFSLRLMRAARPETFARGKAALSGLIGEALPAWRRRLGNIGAADLLREDGHFVVWETPATAAAGLKAWRETDTGTATWREADAEELAALRGFTTVPVAGAIRFEGTGQVADPRRLLDTLAETFTGRGGKIVHDEVTALRIEDGRPVVGTAQADAAVVCAGVWSKPLMEGLGYTVPIVAERGYHIESVVPSWPQGLPPVVFEDRSMIVTRFESGVRAASFVELNKTDAPPDARKWQRLERHVRDLGLPFGDPSKAARWMGARPTLPDYLPGIGRAKGLPVYYAFGHQHLGLTLAAVTAERVGAMVDDGVVPVEFDLARFQ